MLRIVTDSAHPGIALRLEGDVVGPWVETLRRCADEATRAGAALVLDLSRVAFVDRDGLDLLRTLAGGGVSLVNASRFVTEQLRADAR